MKNFAALLSIFFSANLFSQTIFLKPSSQANPSCETKEEREAYIARLKIRNAAWNAANKNSGRMQNPQESHVLFGWPMRVSSEYDAYNYFNLQNFVDQHRFVVGTDGEFWDHHCNNRTYDEHDASDINLWPFWWHMMDNNYVMAVAAAPGVIDDKDDGNFDRNCTKTGSPNSITIRHADGTTTRYLHLKKNSLTTKNENDSVQQGEFLGYIGSSGRSSNPHLHFAVYDANANLIEPFFDANSSCQAYGTDTWWQNQRNYWEPQINRIMTHYAVPSIEFCPDEESMNGRNQFSSSDVMYTGIAFQDGQDGDVAACSLIRPDGGVFINWDVTLTETNSRFYAVDGHILPSGNSGTWIFRVSYRSRVYSHLFTVGCKDNETPSGTINGNSGFITGNFISSTAKHTGASNTRILYQAQNYIELKPGFEVPAGAQFKARIKPCGYVD
jgi:murein DD-endopeptidase MepM/ murein hydrolase activator NlpD